MSKVEVVSHDVNWKVTFADEADRLTRALGDNVIAVHHIGSTAIPGIFAKPVIDILIEVNDHDELDNRAAAFESIGYEVMGEFGIPGRRYFRRDNEDGVRTHQIHAFESGSEHIERHLAFRDYMLAHPNEADRYSNLKQQLVAKYANDAESYMDGKDGFIREIDRRATAWRATDK